MAANLKVEGELRNIKIGLMVFGFLIAATGFAETQEVLRGKKPMIKRSFRPTNFESTVEQLDQDFTPNDAFFVRSHSPNWPKVDLKTWKLSIEGEAIERPMQLSFRQLTKDFKKVEMAALVICSGNRRGQFRPSVQGVQWKDGAVGNAKWMGVRLRDVLQKAGVKSDAIEVAFNGSDFPNMAQTPDFEKSLPIEKALDENTLLAFKMNGVDIPEKHGYPVRLIVPGWTATYWIKHLSSIRVLSKPFDGYWMKKAYRIPKGKFKGAEAAWKGQETDATTPVTEIVVNSQITHPREGDHLKKSKMVPVRGYAWDNGKGIKSVDISLDGGKTWLPAKLGKNLGRYAWRPFSFELDSKIDGEFTVMSRATNLLGQTQEQEVIHNPPGYHHNVPLPVHFTVSGDFKLAALKKAKAATAKEDMDLIDAPGRELVMSNCLICHSAEYIPMNAGILDAHGWEAVVQKMQKNLGAPVRDEDIPKLVEYLSKNYGR